MGADELERNLDKCVVLVILGVRIVGGEQVGDVGLS
jgi:hypothetical protein